MPKNVSADTVAQYARMLKALGSERQLRIVQLLLAAHPYGMTANEIAAELAVPNSTLSHYLNKLKQNDLVNARREGTFLWYTANDDILGQLFGFLYNECCTRDRGAFVDVNTAIQRPKQNFRKKE